MAHITGMRERLHQPLYDRLMTAKEREEAERRHHFQQRSILQFAIDKEWKPCDVCGEDTRCSVLRNGSGKFLPKALTRHIRCHRQLQAGIRQDRGAVLPVVGKDYIFRKPNRHDRKRIKYDGDPEARAAHIDKWKRHMGMIRFEPLMYLNQFDGVKLVSFMIDGINTRDIQ